MQEQNAPARKRFDQALDLTKRTGDERLRSFVLRHIGYLQQTDGQIDEAATNFRESLALRQRNHMKVFVPFAMILLAEFEAEQKHSTEAIKFAEQAVSLAKSGNSLRALYDGQLMLAKLYFGAGRAAEARNLAEQSRSGAEAFGNPADAKEAEDFLRKHP